jgi:hypothetical protein
MLMRIVLAVMVMATMAQAADIERHTRKRDEAGRIVEQAVRWDPRKTALVICDMWDDHW